MEGENRSTVMVSTMMVLLKTILKMVRATTFIRIDFSTEESLQRIKSLDTVSSETRMEISIMAIS
jgi:hypothetical protein